MMSDVFPLPPITAETKRIADYVSSALGIALPQESEDGLVANFRLLLSHWAAFAEPEKEPE